MKVFNNAKAVIMAALSILTSPILFADSPPPWCTEDHNNSILDTISGSKYVAVGVPSRFKADLYLPDGIYRNVYFYSSEDGYIGKDNSGIEGNAYKTITFDSTWSIGSGSVWAEIDGYCAYKNINVQEMPTGAKVSLSGGKSIKTVVTADIHSLSKNAVEGNGLATITYRFINENWGTVETVSTTSKNMTFNPQYRGPYTVIAMVSDGTFSKRIPLGTTFYTGGTNCRTCGEIP